MKYDFIEIGTSNFNTLLEKSKDSEKGISVEPVKFYLESLEDKPLVKKINAGITHNKQNDYIDIYYIPLHLIQQNKLPKWFRGCNKIGSFHPLHISHRVQHLVSIDRVPLKNFSELIIENNVTEVDFIKIDTEGHDCIIMNGISDFYFKNPNFSKPKKIKFETNENSKKSDVDAVIEKFKSLEYKVLSRGYDTVVILDE